MYAGAWQTYLQYKTDKEQQAQTAQTLKDYLLNSG